MKTVIAFCFLILCHGTIAQSASILNSCDSLWTLWLNESNSDSVRLTAILEYSYLKFGRSNPDSSRYILRKEISYAEEKKLPNFVVSGLNDMADTFLEQSAFDSADFYFNQALNLAEKINDKKGLATAYNGIGNTFRLTKHYQKAIDYYLLSLRINTELNNLSGVGSVYNNLGTVNRMIGNYDEAINYFLKSVEIKQHLNEKKWMGGTYSNLGLVYKIQGDFVKALMYYEMAYQIDLELGNISGVSVSLNGLGNLYKQQGNFESALEYYKIALKYFQQLNNKKNSATVLMNIGSVFHLKYEYDSALIYYQNSLEILEEIKDKNGIGVVSNNLGTYYYELGDYEKAIEIHNLSLDIKTKNGDKPGMAYSFVSISLCYLKMDSIDLATEFAIRAYQIAEQIGDVYLLKNTILTLLKINLKTLNYDVASQYLERLIWIIKSQISKNYFTLSEQEKELYFNTMESDIGVYLDFTVFVGDSYPGFKDSSFNLILQTKGITLKSSTLVRKTITESHDSLLLKTYEEWIKKSAKIAELNLSGKDVQELENEARQLEKNLIQRSGVFSDFDKIQNLDWKQVRDGLNPGEAAIEFVHFKSVINLTRSVVYAAFIVKPECQHPEVVNLCTEAELKNILGVIQGNNLSFVERVYGKKSDAKKDLYEKIWQPLEPFLEGVKTVYYSPSGLLHKVSFAAMSKDQDVYLSDVYNFRQMGSTGNLAFENNTSFGELENFLLMGGVQYNTDSTEKKTWDYLPGSLTETNTINTFLQKKKFGVNYFNGPNASEEIFKEKISSSSIVHIATHGFFFPDPEQVREELNGQKENKDESGDLKFRGTTNYANWSFVNNKNPLMRSGIVLANANDVWSRDPLAEGEDGILTAQEVSNLDLRNTKLVVLSACETGLGDIKGSEGVFGLQRAFKMAGVKYLIMSLWQVPDKETSEFMILFYKNLIKLKDIPTAFTKTQKVMREKYDPYYWGAFVLIE